jgi:DNA adenine methylase
MTANVKQQMIKQLNENAAHVPTATLGPATTATPFVKWVGGKRGLMADLTARLPNYHRYYEPFVGGGALFFALAPHPNGATLCDVNHDLIITYKVIQQDVESLIAKLQEHADNHDKGYYYKIRGQHRLADPVAFAARLIYLNKTCFNGLWRVNNQGEFNVPIGRYKNPSIVTADNLRACHRVLQGVDIQAQSFHEIEPAPGDFVYFDPPYDPVNDSSFTKYSKDDFNQEDQKRLRDFAVSLHHQGVHVMLSNADTDFIRDIYQAPDIFKITEVKAARSVNANAKKRGKVGEVLIRTF